MPDGSLTTEQVKAAEARVAKEGYVHRALVGVDQFLNVLTGGYPDETISSRSERYAKKGNIVGKFMSWWLAKVQPQHGARAEAGDLERAEQVEQVEEKDLGVKS